MKIPRSTSSFRISAACSVQSSPSMAEISQAVAGFPMLRIALTSSIAKGFEISPALFLRLVSVAGFLINVVVAIALIPLR